MDLIKEFTKRYNNEPEYVVKSFGRIEIIGNHTDHNHGICCAGTCDLCISGYLRKRSDNTINHLSIGFGEITVDLSSLINKANEKGGSESLIRGVAAYFNNLGYNIGGFDLVSESSIFPGAGVSSSAAYETLIGQIFNHLFNNGTIDKLTIAKAGQYAENVYFGKKSGLLDQIGTGYGNISYIDFKDIDNPLVEKIVYPFNDFHFVIVNTGGNHASLSHLYSEIPIDMWNAAKKNGHDYLRDCTNFSEIGLTEIELKRSRHFFNENIRVKEFKEACENKDVKKFLDLINESRISSTKDLKNMMVENNYEGSPLEATDLAMSILKDKGACRINGGGFAGSIICVVPTILLTEFTKIMGEKYGINNVKEVSINTSGPIVKKL